MSDVCRDGRRVVEAIRAATASLAERGIPDAHLEAEILLAHVLDCDRTRLHAHPHDELPEEARRLFQALVERRLKREPAAYLTQRVGFRNLDLHVDRRALIPRPETEFLVEAVVVFAREAATSGRAQFFVADICAGSGAVALAVAQEIPCARVYATDISEDALAVARINVERCGLSGRVEIFCGNLFEPLRLAGVKDLDAVLSNPPYISMAERDSLAPEVRDYEPDIALWTSEATDFYRPLAQGAAEHLRAGGLLAMEMPAGRAAEIRNIVADTKLYKIDKIARDYAGHERALTAFRI